MKLNEQQHKAVQTVNGRVLVLAGAGSGKTKVIVQRIAHLIENLGVDPQSILGLTFTNKAAAEMKNRVADLIGPEKGKQVMLCTFHSFCMQVLRKEIEKLGYTRDFSLYDEKDLGRLIQQLAREMLNHETELPSLGPTKAALSIAANQGLTEDEALDDNQTWHDGFSKDLYVRLHSTLRAYNAVSFDSLITLTIRLFEENRNVLDQYQERFKYLMIDEYQDTNPAQFKLAELLASKYHNLCVVGDDDQSIYGWRGAEVKNILNFSADHTIKLEQNYRSTSTILDAANAVIKNNQNRHEKKLWSLANEAEPIEIFNAPTDAEEASGVVTRMIRLKESGLKWRDIAILYRSNALSRQFEMALMQASWQKEGKWVRGIPYEVFGGLEFTERSEIKDLLAYLRAIANPLDQEALLRIINVPRRGISDSFLDLLTQKNRSADQPLWDLLEETAEGKINFPSQSRGIKGVISFVELLKTASSHFKKNPLADSLSWLLDTINYKKAIEEEVKSEKMRAFKWENVQECVNALAQYEKDTEDSSLQDFIATTTLARQAFQNQSKKTSDDKVHLMTLHSAKGLEFPVCFLVGLEDGILPHEKSMAETGLEEERRLFYVGITRARKALTLSMARSRMRMGKTRPTNPSRFLFEIPKTLLKVTDHKIFE